MGGKTEAAEAAPKLPHLHQNLPKFVPPTFEGPLPIPESPEDSPLASGGFSSSWGIETASTIVADDDVPEKLAAVEENDQAEKEAEVKAKIAKMIEDSGLCVSQPVSPQFGVAQPQETTTNLLADAEADAAVATGPGSEESAPSSVCSYSSSEDDESDTRSHKGDFRLLSPATFVDEMASPMPLPELIFDLSEDMPPDPWAVPAPSRLLESLVPKAEDAPKLSPQMDTPVDFIDLTPVVLPDSLEPSPQKASGHFDWSVANVEKVESACALQDAHRWLKVDSDLKETETMNVSRSVERFGCQEGSTGGCNTPPQRAD